MSIEFELQLRLTLTSLLQAPNHERNLGEVRIVLMEKMIFLRLDFVLVFLMPQDLCLPVLLTEKHLSNTEFQGHFPPQCNEGSVLGL